MNEHLLLVEDDDAIAVALRLHLEDAGYRLHREADGRHAMAAIDRQRWDLVVTVWGVGYRFDIDPA